jgi:hypothetical protein
VQAILELSSLSSITFVSNSQLHEKWQNGFNYRPGLWGVKVSIKKKIKYFRTKAVVLNWGQFSHQGCLAMSRDIVYVMSGRGIIGI